MPLIGHYSDIKLVFFSTHFAVLVAKTLRSFSSKKKSKIPEDYQQRGLLVKKYSNSARYLIQHENSTNNNMHAVTKCRSDTLEIFEKNVLYMVVF